MVRISEAKQTRPTPAILDSQSVKSARHGGCIGFDAGKRIKGPKRHVLVNTFGLMLAVVVTAGDTTYRNRAFTLFGQVFGWFNPVRLLWVDGGYSGSPFANWV